MSLSSEAAYMYKYSQQLRKINSSLKRLGVKVEKHKAKFAKARNDRTKIKHRKKHTAAATKLKLLLEQHNKLLAKLQQHNDSFLQKLKQQKKL